MTSITDSIHQEPNVMLVGRVQHLLQYIYYPDYSFKVHVGHGGVYIQAYYEDEDIHAHTIEVQDTRKWLISTHMTDSEIVQTAFKCCLTSAEHRVRENFTYKNARVFGPHFDVEDLVKVCIDGRGENGGRK